MPGISVILPVYQGERYLEKCVESVCNQTFSDWELLIVNDGSTDATAAIADSCAGKDARIRVFHRKKNGGVSEARNLGLREAKGDFIAFLDVDDRYECSALEKLWTLTEQGADTAACGHLVLGADGAKTAAKLLPAGVYGRDDISEKLVTPLLARRLQLPVLGGQVWRYLFAAKIIREGKLSFYGTYKEDELFTLEYLCRSEKLAVTEEPLYRYFQNPSSFRLEYRKDLERRFDHYFTRKCAIAKKYGLEAPLWRENNLWAGLLALTENTYHKGNPAKTKEKQKVVEALCKREDFAAAISALVPEGLHPNRQMTANYIRGRHFFLLTQMFRLKYGI